MIEIKEISATEAHYIRKEILRKNIPLPIEFVGDYDEETFHLGAFENNKLIAVSSFMKSQIDALPGMHYQLRGMATLTEFQGKGAGKLMLNCAIKMLTKMNIHYIWCNARIVAVDFYKTQGFEIIGNVFEIPLVSKHYLMFKRINLL